MLEARAAGDVRDPRAPAQLAAAIQAAARLHIDCLGLLEAVAAQVARVKIAADACPQATRVGVLAKADAQPRLVELTKIRVFPQDQAAVGNPPARGVPGQTMTRHCERFDKNVALVAGSDRRGIRRQRRVAVVAPGQGDHGARPRRRLCASEPLEGRGRERAQVRVGSGAVCLFEVFRRLLQATRALHGQAEIEEGGSGPLGRGGGRWNAGRGLGEAAKREIRRPGFVAKPGGAQTRLSRIQERLKRPLVVARAKRQYALLESLRAGGRGVRSPPRNNAKEERNEEETGNPDERAHAPEFTPAGGAPAGTGALRTPG